jgi:hypothetical protein
MGPLIDFSVYLMNVTVNRKATEWKDKEWVNLADNKAVEEKSVNWSSDKEG